MMPRLLRNTTMVTLSLLTIVICACVTRNPTSTGTSLPQRVYRMAGLWERIVQKPGDWVGRTVRVRAVAELCPWGTSIPPSYCSTQTPVLADPGADALAAWMPLVEDENPLLVDLRRLPFAGQLVAPAPSPPWGVLRIYRIRLRAVSESRFTLPICCEAVVLHIEP